MKGVCDTNRPVTEQRLSSADQLLLPLRCVKNWRSADVLTDRGRGLNPLRWLIPTTTRKQLVVRRRPM